MARLALNLPNPLLYPLAALVAGVVLVAGVRVMGLGVPISAGVAVGAALLVSWQRRRRELAPTPSRNLAAEQAFEQAMATAQELGQRSQELSLEASALLTEAGEMEELAELQISCQRLQELPARLRGFARGLDSSGRSLVPVERLRQRLAEEERRVRQASGAIQQQRLQLVQQLRANLDLARRGHDEREVRMLSLTTLLEAAGGELLSLGSRLRQPASNGSSSEQSRGLELVLDRLDDLIATGGQEPST